MAEQATPRKLGRYEILRELGKGAMGVVYEGRDPNIGRRVAIKTARRDVMAASGMAAEMLERFLREARAAGALAHPNIITIYDADEQDDIAYIAMEFVEGGNLADRLRAKQPLPISEIVEFGAAIAEALAAAHDQGIVHRDVKPANILTPVNGPIKVADFGIARVSDSNLTQEGAMIGTPHYMSPEQFTGQQVDGRSDLFSLGIILYELSTGEKPFSGEALSTVMHHVIRTEPVPPAELNFSVPHPLNDVIMQALNKRPDRRYADGRAMAAALRESLKPKPDPNILFGVTLEGEATVNLKPGGDATVLSQPGALPTTTDEADATVARAPKPVVGGGATAPTGGLPKAWLAGGGVLALLLVVVAGLLLTRGGSPPPDPSPATPAAGGAADVALRPETWFSNAVFDIYQANTIETYMDWQSTAPGDRDIDAVIREVTEVPQATVRVYDADTGALLAEREGFSTGRIAWEGSPRRVRYEVVGPGGVDDALTLVKAPGAPDASLGNVVVLLPPAGS